MFPLCVYILCFLNVVANEVTCDSEKFLQDLKHNGETYGGNTTSIENHPYAVAISVFEDYISTGAIVGRSWVLTTASSIYLHPSTQIYLRTGSTFSDRAGQLLEAEEVFVHEGYDGKFDNNLALIKTRNEIKFGEKTKIIEVAAHTPSPGTQVGLCGWGTISIFDDAHSAHRIKEGRMEVMDHTLCKDTLWNYVVTTHNLCAESNTLMTCRFGGGDLLLHDNKLIGLHLGNPSCSLDDPTVFANIPVLKQWVQNRINNHG